MGGKDFLSSMKPNYFGLKRLTLFRLDRGLVCVVGIGSYTDLKDPDAREVLATRKKRTKHAPSPKTECSHLNDGKSKVVTRISS